jgi:alcohol dehydrogenase (cytochrome c)
MNLAKWIANSATITNSASSESPWTRPPARNLENITQQFALALSFVVLGVLICARATGQASRIGSQGPTQQELDTAASDTRDWLYATHDYADQKFVDLKQINTENVKNLHPVCMYQAPENSTAQANPIVYRNTMYVTTQHLTVALDATDCSVRWLSKWTPKRGEAMPQNRGVAIGNGLVVRGTADGYLIAFNSETGALQWEQAIADSAKGYSFTMPPLIYDDLVIIAPAGGELGIKGWVGAFRLSNGEPVWKFNTVPDPGDPAAKTWGPNPAVLKTGGGAVWTPLALDTKRGLVFVPVGNPIPTVYDANRPGENLYTNTALALDAKTGKLAWYYHPERHDQHDWDLTQVGPVFSINNGGQTRDVIAICGKEAVLRLLDLDTHKVIWEQSLIKRENVTVPVTPAGVHICPGFDAGQKWSGSSYDQLNHQLVAQAIDHCSTVAAGTAPPKLDPNKPNNEESQSVFVAGVNKADPWNTARGWVIAFDANTGAVRWKYAAKKPIHAAVVTTAGNLTLTGEYTGEFLALDSRDGKLLYQFQTGGQVGAGIVTYQPAETQYIALITGTLINFDNTVQGTGGVVDHGGAPTVIVFALGK